MANDKFYGYLPEKEESPTKLDRVNPYEFKKGMDLELFDMGIERLRESTPEERTKATEIVLKNLQEHGGYYSGLVQYKGGMNHGSKITETNFKKWLESYMPGDAGTGMVEVDTEIKTDKMTELKEAIKSEIKNILSEFKEEVDPKNAAKINKADAKKDAADKKSLTKHLSSKKDIDAAIQKLEGERKSKEEDRQKAFNVYKVSKKDAAATEKYKKKVVPLQDRIKKIDKELKELEGKLVGIAQEAKMMRREAAGMMMDKKIHLEILEIIKEAGVNLREGAGGVKQFYEIAKTAYMEGLTAGLNVEEAARIK
tara:strand:+ start:61 stop:993 length:933 start_codon:yes stop_codon:yes gene_type:complete